MDAGLQQIQNIIKRDDLDFLIDNLKFAHDHLIPNDKSSSITGSDTAIGKVSAFYATANAVIEAFQKSDLDIECPKTWEKILSEMPEYDHLKNATDFLNALRIADEATEKISEYYKEKPLERAALFTLRFVNSATSEIFTRALLCGAKPGDTRFDTVADETNSAKGNFEKILAVYKNDSAPEAEKQVENLLLDLKTNLPDEFHTIFNNMCGKPEFEGLVPKNSRDINTQDINIENMARAITNKLKTQPHFPQKRPDVLGL